jgi:hypothetical protein
MPCFRPRRLFNLHVTGQYGAPVYVFSFTTITKAVDHANKMKWPGKKWIMECTPDFPDFNEIQVWEKTGI